MQKPQTGQGGVVGEAARPAAESHNNDLDDHMTLKGWWGELQAAQHNPVENVALLPWQPEG